MHSVCYHFPARGFLHLDLSVPGVRTGAMTVDQPAPQLPAFSPDLGDSDDEFEFDGYHDDHHVCHYPYQPFDTEQLCCIH